MPPPHLCRILYCSHKKVWEGRREGKKRRGRGGGSGEKEGEGRGEKGREDMKEKSGKEE